MNKEELNEEKLLDALKYISLICSNMKSCMDCPLRNGLPSECTLKRQVPRHWKIKTKDEKMESVL